MSSPDGERDVAGREFAPSELKVLLITAGRPLSEQLRERLELDGYTVTVSTPARALADVTLLGPDLVFVDRLSAGSEVAALVHLFAVQPASSVPLICFDTHGDGVDPEPSRVGYELISPALSGLPPEPVAGPVGGMAAVTS